MYNLSKIMLSSQIANKHTSNNKNRQTQIGQFLKPFNTIICGIFVLALELTIQAPSVATTITFIDNIIHPSADQDTQDPGGGTEALGINNLGQIVGEYTDINGNLHGYLLDNGTYWTIDINSPNSQTEALGINNNGDIVGTYIDGGIGKGFRVNVNDVIAAANTPIPPAETIDIGGVVTLAVGINDNSTIIGGFFDPVTGKIRSFRKNSNVVDIFDASGEDVTSALGINNAGQIVGATGVLDPDGVDGFGSELGFLAENDLTIQEFSVFDALITGAFGINDHGDISGFFAKNINSQKAGFVSLSDGSEIEFSIPNASKTALGDINDFGTFVGVYQETVTGPDFGFVAQVEKKVSKSVPEPIPEPVTILATGTAIVFRTGFKRKLAKAKKK